MELKDKLPLIRKDRGLSQEGLAEKIGVTRQAVAKWELGQGYPDVDNLIRLSNEFKISIDRLVKPEAINYFISNTRKEAIDYDDMIEFLCRAKKNTYAGKGPLMQASRPKSNDLQYEEGEYLYFDTYLGGEKFCGEEAVWYQGSPIWSMNYCGHVLGGEFSGDFLKEALSLVSEVAPYRGPNLYQNGDYVYYCNVLGDFEWFNGKEEIFCQAKKIYECNFHGGSVK